jgi:adenylate cyclase
MLIKNLKLRNTISTAFLLLGIPSFISFVGYSYYYNYQIQYENAENLIKRHHGRVEAEFDGLLDQISDSISYIKLHVNENPETLNNDKNNPILALHLKNNPELVSIYIATETGRFRQVQRMTKTTTVAGRIPSEKAKSNLWVLDKAKNGDMVSTFTFFDEKSNKVDSFAIKDDYDPRKRPFYKGVLKTLIGDSTGNFIQIDDPYLSRSTNKPTLTLATPIVIKNNLMGIIGESFELESLAGFLKNIKVSENSSTYILDEKFNIIVQQDIKTAYKINKNSLKLLNINDVTDSPLEYVAKERGRLNEEVFAFTYGDKKTKYLALLTTPDKNLGHNWSILTIAPQEDFLGPLRKVTEQLGIFSFFVLVIVMLVSFYISRFISRPIEKLTLDIKNLLDFKEDFQFKDDKSKLYEIQILSDAVKKLKSTLGAFTSYVPRDLVNDLLSSGKQLEISGESRYLTIFFSDLQNFSGLSEQTPARELLARVSSYLELFTYAIKEEKGTVDKFIGDSVMAFWGAPLPDHDHAFHSCKAALKGQKRMITLNQKLLNEGKPMLTVRIGIHSDAVLVGNIGSQERLSYTVMGDGVNIASRLEGVNKEYSTKICISHSVFKEAGEKLWVRPIDQITVKGRKTEIVIYELIGTRDDDPETTPTNIEKELCLETQRAFNFYSDKQYSRAKDEYLAIATKYQDAVSLVLAEKCRQLELNDGLDVLIAEGLELDK